MDLKKYLEAFQNAAAQLDEALLEKKQVEVAIGVVLGAVCLKLYKKAWASPSENPLTTRSRIFFSIWVNDISIEKGEILYNIHALKLRLMKGYFIQSRKFAENFRDSFKDFDHKWQNVSVKFGPQTLMQGWLKINEESFQDNILNLANNFLEIEDLIDQTLANFK